MNDKEFLKELIARGELAGDGYFHYVHLVACLLPAKLHEQLSQLVNGPVWDGDVISKSDRGDLFELGLAIRVCFQGNQGYAGATYFAYSVLKQAEQIRTGTIAS